MTRQQNGTGQDRHTLTDQQLRALELLVEGKTKTDVAKALGVSRETVSRWANKDPHFIATLNDMRFDLHEAHADQLRQSIGEAVAVLAEAMGEDFPPHIRIKAARSIIEMGKGLKANIGGRDPVDVQNRLANEQQLQEQLSILAGGHSYGGFDAD